VPALTGLRAVAAYCVLLAHNNNYFIGLPGDPHFLYMLRLNERLAYFSMSLFFVLSGFVIHLNYVDLIATKGAAGIYRFFVARFSRLYPIYAVWLVMYFAMGTPDPRSEVFWSHVTLTQSWINLEEAAFAASWSVSTEWFFYVAFVPAILLLPAMRRPGRTLAVYLSAVLMGLFALFQFKAEIVHALTTWFAPLLVHGKGSAELWYPWFTYYCPLVRVAEFAAGALSAKVYREGSSNGWTSSPAFGCAGAAWCAAILFLAQPAFGTPLGDLVPNFLYAPGLCAVLLYCCHTNRAAAVLGSLPFRFLGEISYSVYLWQWNVQAQVNASMPLSATRILVVIGWTTVIASLSFMLVEWPARRALRFLLVRPPDGWLGWWRRPPFVRAAPPSPASL
jgi:peptidoglycan/LPS O-acetylase OafA/YrhL